tara:strand:- start:65 stop:532 length:468 start_codon:yes stop_codon:yes gene_type:complete
MKNNIKFLFSYFFCTIFKVGNIKFMPGTLGSIIGLFFGIIFKIYLPITIYILIIILIILMAIISIDIYQNRVGKEDKSEIIIDEFIGQQIPLFFIELTTFNILLCFFFFRFFDILKIYPSNYIDKNFKNSYGIISDDIIAGIQALLIIYLIHFFI